MRATQSPLEKGLLQQSSYHNKNVSMKKCVRKMNAGKLFAYGGCLVALVLIAIATNAQDGVAGINEANTKVRGYFSAGTNLMYAVGAIVGLIGAIKVFNKWIG